ncbi:MAG: type II toxin-antitoxin system RelE/ParE family toxin [Blastochloris sp.]|nr:type II toxin-antitoxin system RelE/ParE family toxin [Blastochloris sp.]
MVWKITFRIASRNDLRRIVDYIDERDGAMAAEACVSQLLQRATGLIHAPYAGRPMPERKGARILVEGSYLIIYRAHSQLREIRILRFWHGARRNRPSADLVAHPA